MSKQPLPILSYADPGVPIRPHWPFVVLQLASGLLKTCWVLLRIALLITGMLLTIAGTVLLVLGGKESASREIRAYGRQVAGTLRKWRAEIAEPLRRWWAAYVHSFSVPA